MQEGGHECAGKTQWKKSVTGMQGVCYAWKELTGHCYSGHSSLGNNRASGTQPIRKRDTKGEQKRLEGKPDGKRQTVTSNAASHPPTHKHTEGKVSKVMLNTVS